MKIFPIIGIICGVIALISSVVKPEVDIWTFRIWVIAAMIWMSIAIIN